MKSLFTVILAVTFGVATARASGNPESVNSSNAAGFDQTRSLQQKTFKTQKYVTVSGSVHLSGTGFVFGDNGGFVSVRVSGSANLTGEGGRVQTGYATISENASFYLGPNQSHVSQYVSVNQHVSLYCDGKPVGSTNVSGGVNVSGWKSGSSINVSGSGMLSGTAFVDCGDEKSEKPAEPKTELPGRAVPSK